MKKILLALLGIAVMALGCKREAGFEDGGAGRLTPLTIQAELPDTRTHIEEMQTGWQPCWNDDDSVFVTLRSDLSKAFPLINTTGAGTTATFKGNVEYGISNGAITIWAFAPRKGSRAEGIFKFDTGPVQNLPGLSTFDPAADVLISDPALVMLDAGKVTEAEKLKFNRKMAIVRVKVLDATNGSQLAGKKIKAVKLSSSSQTLSGRVRVNIVTGDFDEKRFENEASYKYVNAIYDGDDWTAGGDKGAFLIVNPCTLPAGSTISLAVTFDDQSTVTHSASVPENLELVPNRLPTFSFAINDSDMEGGGEELPGDNMDWNFASEEWQAAFAKYGAANTDITNWDITLNHLNLVSAAKSKYRETFFQMGGKGSTSDRYFKFTAPADGVLKVWTSNTGDTEDLTRKVTVSNGGSTDSKEGGYAAKDGQHELTFSVSAGEVYVYPDGNALRFYKLSYSAGGSIDEPGNEPGDEPAAAAELECTDPPAVGQVQLDAIDGFAKAANVSGGAGGSVLHFNNGKALQTWLLARAKSEKKGDHSPVVIWLSGTFGPGDGRDFSEAHPWFDVKEVSNLSFFGTDGFVMDRIGIFCVRASNIVIRNINFQQPKANNGADAVSMQECDGVWVDHCTFTSLNQVKDFEDGSTDITHGSKNVTVSWCRYIKTQKSCLVGHSNNQSGDAAITATFHHNWFDGSSSRHPRVRFGTAHVYNNLFDGCTTYGVGSAYGAKVLVEYNYFDAVQLPTDICTYPAKESNESNLQGSVAGYLYPTENVYVNRPAKAKDPYPLSNVKYKAYNGETLGTPLTYADFKPTYSYTVTAAADVPSVVKDGAGYGKLGWTAAPVDVDNGGISEYNGTEEDPVNPDPGNGEEDPEQPGDSSAHTYILCVNDSKTVIKTTDGVSGSNYFTNSESLADFSKDYNGPTFTVNDTAYKYGLKFDSKGSVSFTTSATFNSTVRFFFVRRKSGDTGAKMQLVPAEGEAQVFETPYDAPADSGEIALQKGMTYTVKQKSNEQALIYIIVKESE